MARRKNTSLEKGKGKKEKIKHAKKELQQESKIKIIKMERIKL